MTDLLLPFWHPSRAGATRAHHTAHSMLRRALRAYFDERAFVEIAAPLLQITPCMDIHIHGLKTTVTAVDAISQQDWYLHTSPEFFMKKLLVAGMERIYFLGPVFRDREGSPIHKTEFTMLEWYRAGSTLSDLMADCVTLAQIAVQISGHSTLRFQDRSCDPFTPPTLITCREAFDRYATIDLDACLQDREKLSSEARRIGLHHTADDAWDDLFARIVMDRIEPHLGHGALTFLCDYPADLAMLARRKKDDPRYAERFELYACGIELANAYDELTDAGEQRARFIADMAAKKRLYGFDYPIDEDFLRALAAGMPPACGIALGFDRLAMLAAGGNFI